MPSCRGALGWAARVPGAAKTKRTGGDCGTPAAEPDSCGRSTPGVAAAHAHRTRLLRPWTARVFVDGFESGIALDVSHGGSIARTLAGAAAGWPTALIAARVQVQVLRRSGSMAGVNRGAVIKGARCRERVMQRCTLPGLCQQQQQVLHKSSAARAVPGSDSLQHERLRGASPLQ